MNEFDLIRRYFVPLAKDFSGGLDLRDDAAVIDVPLDRQLVVTKDAMSAGIHFIGDEDPALVAKKLLRTNLSDLASMGADPLCYFLSIALPKPLSPAYIARFVEGLAEDQAEFGIHLAGGDTIATLGTPTFSLTAHGLVPKGQALRRSGAKVGECIYVSGTLGDAAMGLRYAMDYASNSAASPEIMRDLPAGVVPDDVDYLVGRYLLPHPRLTLGKSLRGIATACMDISDGLMQDLGHVCQASHVGAEIDMEDIPLSSAAQKILMTSPELWPLIYSGGDDYELLFTLPNEISPPADATHIGHITEGKSVKLLHNGVLQTIASTGYSH